MDLATSCVPLLFAFAVISPTKTFLLTGAVPKQKILNAPENPRIPNTFQVQVEGIFKNSKTGTDGTLYFDRPHNIAAIDMLWQNDFIRTIYSFDTNERLSIKGYDCDVVPISDNPNESFFPFTIDPDSKRKVLSPPEEALYFKNSKFIQNDYHGDIDSYLYQGYIDVPMYQKKNCSVTHHFSMPDFETAHCDSRFCESVLLSISVYCAGVEVETEGERVIVGEVNHIYKFYSFASTIQDESVFHPPRGVHCDRKNTKTFPFLPIYFSFSYDLTENTVQVENVGGLKILHKKVWYDGDLELIRVDGFDNDGFLKDTRIYDFYNGMAYSAFPQINQTSMGELDTRLSLNQITLLPREVFPRTIQESQQKNSPVFVGLRNVHGLEYHVWSVKTQNTEDSPKVITELYFQTIISERDGEIIKEAGEQLSFLEIYTYLPDDEEPDSPGLSQVTFVPVSNFQSTSRDFSAFDISSWFEKDEKKAFEIDVTGPVMIVGTKSYSDFLEQIILEIVTLARISITRICKLEVSYMDPATNKSVLSGWILESPGNLGYKQQKNESDLNTVFSIMETLMDEDVEFTITDKNGVIQTFVLSSFRQATTGNKVSDITPEDKKSGKSYSGGVMAATALIMLIAGIVVGGIGMKVLKNKLTEKQKSISSNGNRRLTLNFFS